MKTIEDLPQNLQEWYFDHGEVCNTFDSGGYVFDSAVVGQKLLEMQSIIDYQAAGSDLIDGVAQLKIDEMQKRIDELEHDLVLSTDQNDLLLDEFIRVKHLTDNSEIHGLCERAHLRMRQRVSVIERNHELQKQINELQQENGKIKNFLGNLNRTKEFKQFTLDNADLIRSFKK